MPRTLAIAAWMTALAVPGFAQVVSYDGNVFPEDTNDSWVHLEQIYQAERWLDFGWLVQNPTIVDQGPPVVGERDSYRRELDDQAGISSWFLEWVMVTNGPQAFGAVAPAVIAAAGTSGVLYHFTIAKDRMSFKRGAQFPIVFTDIEEGVPHRYRLELQNTPLPRRYLFTIDGEVADAGLAESFYPTADSFIIFRGKAAIENSVTKWDSIRFGRIPIAGSGDMTGDGLIDLEDFRFFDECLAEGGPDTEARAGCLFADMDDDRDVDFADLALFQIAFTGAGQDSD